MKFSIDFERRRRFWLWYYWQTIYVVEEDYSFVHLDGNTYTIPAGFRSDFASIPWFLRWFWRQDGPWAQESVVHDFLYDMRIATRLLADLLYLLSLVRNPKVLDSTAQVFYLGVRLGGKRWWMN